jgi:protein TonB
MIARYAFAIVTGTMVTLGLLYLMQFLIESGEKALVNPGKKYYLEFVRVKRNETVNTEDLTPEKPPKPQETPDVPPQEMDSVDPNAPTINIPPPTVASDTSVAGPGGMNIAEGDYLPIVRVAPVYPARALARGIEGYVDMEFTVTTTGTVINPIVVFSTSGLFNRAAERAVLKFKYKPRVVDGQPVEVPGVRTRITFKIEN